ncbi:hypothetical protein KBD81_00965 [Candidatus Woesebacteria bacterium]|nr:hypothetical protein [Candidatus Woesebacteria bacterium]
MDLSRKERSADMSGRVIYISPNANLRPDDGFIATYWATDLHPIVNVLVRYHVLGIVEDMRRRFGKNQSTNFGARGVLFSTEGVITLRDGGKDIDILPLQEILNNGTENPSEPRVNIEPFTRNWDIPSMASYYLVASGKRLCSVADPADRQKLLPALLLYDLSLLQHVENGYPYQLSESAEERSRAILAAYPVSKDYLPANLR